MHFTTSNNHPSQTGFTLVEVLIVAPIALLVISGFVALMVTLTGDVLASSARTNMIQKTNQALERIEQDVRFAKEFRAESFTPIAPQGRADNDEPFDVYSFYPETDPDYYGTVRILRSYATDKNPLDPTKNLIYTQDGPGSCGNDTKTQNDPYEYDIVYYLKRDSGTLNSDDLRMSLWRRIIFNPVQTPCLDDIPWQRSTCKLGGVGAPCQAQDEKVIDNIVNGGVGGYYPNTPDRSYSGNPALEPSQLDCILACPHGGDLTDDTNNHSGHTSDDVDNILSPYSQEGENAQATYFFLSTKTTIAGRDSEYSSGIYARRLN